MSLSQLHLTSWRHLTKPVSRLVEAGVVVVGKKVVMIEVGLMVELLNFVEFLPQEYSQVQVQQQQHLSVVVIYFGLLNLLLSGVLS